MFARPAAAAMLTRERARRVYVVVRPRAAPDGSAGLGGGRAARPCPLPARPPLARAQRIPPGRWRLGREPTARPAALDAQHGPSTPPMEVSRCRPSPPDGPPPRHRRLVDLEFDELELAVIRAFLAAAAGPPAGPPPPLLL